MLGLIILTCLIAFISVIIFRYFCPPVVKNVTYVVKEVQRCGDNSIHISIGDIENKGDDVYRLITKDFTTGLCDKNGVNVFVGDVIRLHSTDNECMPVCYYLITSYYRDHYKDFPTCVGRCLSPLDKMYDSQVTLSGEDVLKSEFVCNINSFNNRK